MEFIGDVVFNLATDVVESHAQHNTDCWFVSFSGKIYEAIDKNALIWAVASDLQRGLYQ